MKWAKNALSSSFYISFRSPYEGIPSPNPPPFQFNLYFPFTVSHSLGISAL